MRVSRGGAAWPRTERRYSTFMQAGASLSRLVEIMDRLLGPGGCPWDREQTLESLRPFLVEETYEVLDALSRNDVPGHCEELGDLLMQIVFHAAIRNAEGAFDIDRSEERRVGKECRSRW